MIRPHLTRAIGLLAALLPGGIQVALAQQLHPLAWPAPPDPARVTFVGSLSSEADLGKRTPFLKRLARALTGGQRDAILRLERPFDLYTRDGERVYFTNGTLGAVVLLDRKAKKGLLLGADVPGGLRKPMGLGGDGHDSLYVADAGNRRVVVLGPDGHFVRAIGGTELLLNPVDVAVDAVAGRVYVVDSYLHQVLVFDPEGALLGRLGKQAGRVGDRPALEAVAATPDTASGHTAGSPSDLWENRGGAAGEFRYPVSAAVGPAGTLYISDQMNFRVQVFSRDGHHLRSIGRLGDQPGTFTRPKGVAVDSEGHLYVADGAFNNVQMFDEEGRLLMSFGSLGVGPGQHWLPLGLAIDQQDRIYVADRYNNRAQIYQYLSAAGPPEPAPAQ
jgi:DNA-binding beta-propeller fold protein YncE